MKSTSKRILLLAPEFYSLHLQIIEELESMGYEVVFIPDKLQKYNPNCSSSSFPFIKRIYYHILNPNLKYMKETEEQWNKKIDILLVINGFSFDKYLINKLKKNNPQIKSILYLWDGINFFDFTYNFCYFNSIYTFDSKDAEKYKLKLLPLFWVQHESKNIITPKYDLCFIGTSHSDRFSILKEIEKQCILMGVSNYIKLVVKDRNITILDYFRYFLNKRKDEANSKGFVNDFLYLTGKKNESFLTKKALSPTEFEKIIAESKCIIDLELPYQSGITHRMISALANKKKIITTNSAVKDYFFYDCRNIQIIDRFFPKIDSDFLHNNYCENVETTKYMESLKINNWLKLLIKSIS